MTDYEIEAYIVAEEERLWQEQQNKREQELLTKEKTK
jgi:hypothetical protein|tara:strand:+ start:437 stop:547 length:111 start_codon:yes stop_codon:yes gene_type:complete